MEFKVNEIPEEGLDLAERFSASSMDMETSIIKFPRPFSVNAHITREKDDIFVEINIEGVRAQDCSRCLVNFEVPISINKKFLYSARGKTVINIDPGIREEIILDYPLKPLCKETCKGLCPICGKDLNESECSCNKNVKGWRK